jgi:hypothetical protein
MTRAFPLRWGQVGGSLTLICLKTINRAAIAAAALAPVLLPGCCVLAKWPG